MTKRRAVNLGAVREARASLQRLAREHPELAGAPGRTNRTGWESELEDAMADETKDEQIVVRLPKSLLDRIDAQVDQLRRAMPGPSWKRSDVVRLLLERSLDKADPAPKKGKKA
jgi:hypothetical protein